MILSIAVGVLLIAPSLGYLLFLFKGSRLPTESDQSRSR
jgi:hypothetical protein